MQKGLKMNDNTFDILDWNAKELQEIEARKPSERTLEDWLFLTENDFSTMEDKDFPFEQLSVEDWKKLILREPIILQYNPPVKELLDILTKKDFEHWSSYDICQALFFDGVWLAEAKLLPMEKISQEDFDYYFGATPFPTPEDFWEEAPGYFPAGFPPHIRLPFPAPNDQNGTD